MRLLFHLPRSLGGVFIVIFSFWSFQAQAQTNVPLRVMSANLNGNVQSYQPFALRIFEGLKPDVVAIQEFNYGGNTDADFRSMLDAAFGTNFVYFREPGGYSIPNGIISRYPISGSNSWSDPLVGDRGIAWARIDLPGTNHLYVVSVHLDGSTTASGRDTEATFIKNQIQSTFPAGAWVIVAGDFNTGSRSEQCMNTFKTFLSDDPIPTDNETGGNANTNEPRNKPYDYVLPSFSFTNFLTASVFPSHTYSNGLVFDSRVYAPLSDVAPVLPFDSTNAQHMAVIKDFLVPGAITNPSSNAPSITSQPQSQTVASGQDATFTVSAGGGSPLSYQWRFTPTNTLSPTNIAGATASTYVRSNAQSADAGMYSVVVTNTAGGATSSVATLTVIAAGPSTVIAQWNFNSTTADADTGTGTTSPSVGVGTASLVGGTTQAFFGGSSTDPASSGTDNSGWSTTTFPALTSGNKTAGVQFNVSTAGRQNINIRWDQRASNTGSKYVRLQYSTNGSAFVDFPTANAFAAATVFEAETNSLAGIVGVNNNANFAFRIVAEFESTAASTNDAMYVGAGGSYGTAGTLRFDMVTVSGSAIAVSNPPPAPATLSAPFLNGGGQFQLAVAGASGSNYVVQASSDLGGSNWVPLGTNVSPFTFVDTNTGAHPFRFYRALAQ